MITPVKPSTEGRPSDNDAARFYYEALAEVKIAQQRLEIAEAYRGLDSLLKGAWGSGHVQALGGGVVGITKARAALGRLIIEASADLPEVSR